MCTVFICIVLWTVLYLLSNLHSRPCMCFVCWVSLIRCVCVCPGTLYLRSTVAHLGTASVTLSLSARDGGGRTSATPARLTVNVVGSAQAPAVFQRSRYSFSVAEDAPPGTSVGTVTAVCPGSEYDRVWRPMWLGCALWMLSECPQKLSFACVKMFCVQNTVHQYSYIQFLHATLKTVWS